MKLQYKGIYRDESQLPLGNLPKNAVPFEEPDNPADLSKAATWYIIPVFLVIFAVYGIKCLLCARILSPLDILHPAGVLLSFLVILPHDLLHGICFPKDAVVELWISPKNLMAFVVGTAPMSRRRFIFMSLLPNLVFGLLPMLIWIFLPSGLWGNCLGSMGAYAAMMGIGDYLNIANTLRQMPADALTQLSGFHSYWYYPSKENLS